MEGGLWGFFSKEKFEEIKKSEKTIIIYEAPHKMKNTLQDLKDVINDRKIVLSRELTKIHEEFIRKNINELLDNIDNLKGEMILIIEGNKKEKNEENELNFLSIEEHYKYYEKQGYDKKEIIKKIAKDRNVNKNFYWIFFSNIKFVSYFYRYNNSSKFINFSYNSCRFHYLSSLNIFLSIRYI